MYFALDQNNNRINIDDAIEQDIKACKCCFCKSEMNIRNGDVRRAHFAHKKGTMGTTVCDTFWSNRKLTDWYFGWVDKFADEYREQIIENEKTGERHMVDLRIGNSVVFFVDGNLKPGEFEKQNRFFNNNGYRVRWIFRETDRFEGRYIRFTNELHTEMEWKWARNTLNNYRPSDDVIVYLQLKDGDKSFIVQVSQVYGYNMSMFQVAPPHYEGIEEFIGCLMEDGAPKRITSETIRELKEEVKQRALEESCTKLKAEIEAAQSRRKEIEEQKKTQVQRTGLVDFYMHDSSCGLHPWEVKHPYPENCVNINTIIKEYDICLNCRYHLNDYKLPQDVYKFARYTACICKFKDMNLLPTDRIIKVGRSIEGIVDEVEVERNGEIITYTFDLGEKIGKSLLELWKAEYKRMRVLNLKTGWKFQLTNPNEMRYRYRGRVYSEKICGPESNNYYLPRTGNGEIYDVDCPVWQLVWAAIGN